MDESVFLYVKFERVLESTGYSYCENSESIIQLK